MKAVFLTITLAISFVSTAFAQLPERRISKEEYIEMYKDIAIEEMNTFGIPASITLAQGILESSHGNSTLAKKANNHFGIKCHKGWNGKTYHMDDDAHNECFRQYKSSYESYKDHSIFLSTRDRYAFLFELDISDYEGWANGLKKAGYATNPNYPQLLIKIIEDHELFKYDRYYDKTLAAKNKSFSDHEVVPAGQQVLGDFKPLEMGEGGRQIYSNNGLKFIFAREGDDFYKIAQDFNIYTFQIYKYNDLKKKEEIREGQIIYLEKKKNHAGSLTHTVKPGETLHDISQMYGIRLKKLCKYNSLAKDAVLYPDQKIKLRK
ncbi:MAG: glucosaminidase domain-containing protein [Bacteroidales bacterium]|nr:glucosaminidase domain-containing protein [Bacteroidales bacterium]